MNPFQQMSPFLLRQLQQGGGLQGFLQQMAQSAPQAGQGALGAAGLPPVDMSGLGNLANMAGGAVANFGNAAAASLAAPWQQKPNAPTATPKPAATAAATASMAPRPPAQPGAPAAPVTAGDDWAKTLPFGRNAWSMGAGARAARYGSEGPPASWGGQTPKPANLSPASPSGFQPNKGPNGESQNDLFQLMSLPPNLGGDVARPATQDDLDRFALDGEVENQDWNKGPPDITAKLDPMRQVTSADTDQFKPRGPLDKLKMWASRDEDNNGITRGQALGSALLGIAKTLQEKDQLTPLGQEMPDGGMATTMGMLGNFQQQARQKKADARGDKLFDMQVAAEGRAAEAHGADMREKNYSWEQISKRRANVASWLETKSPEERANLARLPEDVLTQRMVREAIPMEYQSAGNGTFFRIGADGRPEFMKNADGSVFEMPMTKREERAYNLQRMAIINERAKRNELTDKEISAFRAQFTPYKNTIDAARKIRGMLANYNDREKQIALFAGAGGDAQQLVAEMTQLALYLKENNKLGALSGPDQMLMEAIAGNPTPGNVADLLRGRFNKTNLERMMAGVEARAIQQHRNDWEAFTPSLRAQINFDPDVVYKTKPPGQEPGAPGAEPGGKPRDPAAAGEPMSSWVGNSASKYPDLAGRGPGFTFHDSATGEEFFIDRNGLVQKRQKFTDRAGAAGAAMLARPGGI